MKHTQYKYSSNDQQYGIEVRRAKKTQSRVKVTAWDTETYVSTRSVNVNVCQKQK